MSNIVLHTLRYGSAFPGHSDFDAFNIAEQLKICDIETGSHLVVDAARLLIKRGTLDYTKVCFEYHKDGKIVKIQHNKEGQLEEWPEGFCDEWDKILEELVGWN